MVRTYTVKSQKEYIQTFLTKNPVFVEAVGEKNWRLCNGHQEVTNSQIDDEYVGWSLKAPSPAESVEDQEITQGSGDPHYKNDNSNRIRGQKQEQAVQERWGQVLGL